VVPASDAWEGLPKLIHEQEAVFDQVTSSCIERKHYQVKTG
jgi:hypothetical protein